jgi:hypothetical protein
MREVPVPTGFAPQRCRRLIVRPIVILAAWLIVLQGFLAALATAQAGAILLSVPAEAAVICHAAGNTGSSDAGDAAEKANEKAKQALHLCCACCACCAAAAVSTPEAPSGAVWEPRSTAAPGPPRGFTLVAARGLIRAGPSQGPPSLA